MSEQRRRRASATPKTDQAQQRLEEIPPTSVPPLTADPEEAARETPAIAYGLTIAIVALLLAGALAILIAAP